MNKLPLPQDLFNDKVFDNIRERINYYQKSIDKYYCHIFLAYINSTKELQINWELINNIIASNFQSQLEQDIELWNIYIVFVVNDSVSKEIKYKIEQDKYSSRKLVFDVSFIKSLKNEEIALINHIENKLFYLKSNVYEDSLQLQTSEDIIKIVDVDILKSLSSYKTGNKIESFYNIYLNLKNGK